jgi:hypothetical protein
VAAGLEAALGSRDQSQVVRGSDAAVAISSRALDVVLLLVTGVPKNDLVAAELDNSVLLDNTEFFSVVTETCLTGDKRQKVGQNLVKSAPRRKNRQIG